MSISKKKFKPIMKMYTVRIQADLRADKTKRYQEYPSPEEYDHVWRPEIINRSGLQNGFHECVNFKNFNGKIKGYLPPKPGYDSDWIDDDDEVCFVFVTNKSPVSKAQATKLGLFDVIVGIQVGCHMVWGENGDGWFWHERKGVPSDLKEYLKEKSLEKEGQDGVYNLVYHYVCPYENSLLFNRPIPEASEKIFPRKEHNNCVWGVNSVREIKLKPERVIKAIDEQLEGTNQYSRWKTLKKKICQ